ncbi:LLM class flavin-dependent oxidoreductase [Sphingobium mellinum]|uniref:LLM class flavin-dependent oxidoreductase n=1 Tax=Sphingobium mellinum TaxID=1387166 RepID=UPI0030EBC9DD
MNSLTNAQSRESINPIFNDNKMKLGVFGFNASNGCAVTMAPERHIPDWDRDLLMAQAADRMGFEALVPLGRWRGFDGETNFNGASFETTTWAAGLGASTRNPSIMATQHVPTVHPIVAAKQAATVDQISGGRYGLNIVCGWFTPEMEMFGGKMMEHDLRYDYAQEWIDVVKMLWSKEDYFDFEGKFFNIKKGFSQPKPIQKPFPPLMNAGGSPKGMDFAARNCEMVYLLLDPVDVDKARAQVAKYKDLARERYNRDIQVWCYVYVVQRDTQKEAEDFLKYYAEQHGDDVATDNILKTLGVETGIWSPEEAERFKFHFKAGWGGYPLVGTPERIVDTIQTLSDIGLDGISLTWVDYTDGIERWEKGVMPLLEQSGLRKSFVKTSMAA